MILLQLGHITQAWQWLEEIERPCVWLPISISQRHGAWDYVIHAMREVDGLRCVEKQNWNDLTVAEGWVVVIVGEGTQTKMFFVCCCGKSFSTEFDLIIPGTLLQCMSSKLSEPRALGGYCEQKICECVQGGTFLGIIGLIWGCCIVYNTCWRFQIRWYAQNEKYATRN